MFNLEYHFKMASIRYSDISAVMVQTLEKLSLAGDVKAITQIVAEAARKLTGADGTTFVLRENEKCYYANEDAISPLWKGQKFPMEACISGWSMLHKEVVSIRDIYLDSRIPHAAYRPTFVKSLCMVPIRSQDPVGAIGNYWSREYTPSPEEIKILQSLANSTAVALENLELKRSMIARMENAHLYDKTKEFESALCSIAHDLRNPVGAVAAFAELATMDLVGSGNASVLSCLRSISETAEQMNRQIESMLSLYRATSSSLHKEKINLSDLFRKVSAGMQARLGPRPLHFEIEDGLQAFADPALMQVVAENLIGNAIKYSSKKPFTDIHVARHDNNNSFGTFFVKDNGEGFDQTQSHKLFRPLGRLHQDSEFKGTGLGLFSVAKIIELHGGSIRAETRPSHGATFFFSLPVAIS